MSASKLHIALVGAIFILACAGGLWWQMLHSGVSKYDYVENAQAPGHGNLGKVGTDTDPFDVTIEYTDNGYMPADITIKKGQRVHFVNTSNESTWPASGLHPTHTLYPEKEKTDCLGSSFDACADLKKGEFFDFTFNYVGVWRYHDHIHPYQAGSITVR